jgi:hypothetical protein
MTSTTSSSQSNHTKAENPALPYRHRTHMGSRAMWQESVPLSSPGARAREKTRRDEPVEKDQKQGGTPHARRGDAARSLLASSLLLNEVGCRPRQVQHRHPRPLFRSPAGWSFVFADSDMPAIACCFSVADETSSLRGKVLLSVIDGYDQSIDFKQARVCN